jgi:hypothetical protein
LFPSGAFAIKMALDTSLTLHSTWPRREPIQLWLLILDRLWLVGALLTIGDALAKHSYFDHAPELELLRHLRNGVAHGNTFRINLKLLAKFPAHNRLAWVRSDSKAEFEITPNLQNQPVLFDFMGPGDIIHLLMSVGLYLIRMGNGDALRP